MTRRDYIVLHHSLTKDGETVSWGAIEEYHLNEMGMRDIGYHYGIELIGKKYFALVGRPEEEIAAACKQAEMNARGIHVCFVGNYDEHPAPLEMVKVALRRVILPVMHRHGIPPERIIGHRDAGIMDGFDWRKNQFKTCPGTAFDMDLVRRLAA